MNSIRIDRRIIVVLAFSVLAALALFGSLTNTPRQLDAAPVDLSVPALAPDQLGQWCVDRKAQGTAGLSTRAKNWLTDCIAIFGTGLTPSPSSSPTPTPSATQSPSPSPTASPSPTVSPTPTVTTPPPTTPPPSPSPSPSSGLLDCLHQLAACGFPNAANTGASGSLVVVNGNVSLSTPGMTYQDKDVRGCITVTAANVTIKNVKVTCGGIEAGGNYTRIQNNSTGLTLTDVEVDCGDNYGSGIGSSNFTAIRINAHHCENGFNVDAPGNVTVRDSYVHDLWTGVNDSGHADGMQWGDGASNITIEHNTIYNDNGQTSAIIMWDETGNQNNNVLVRNNILAGGGYTLYCGRFGTSANVVITNNRFAAWAFKPSDSCVSPHVTTWSGNISDATGASLAAG